MSKYLVTIRHEEAILDSVTTEQGRTHAQEGMQNTF
jgi:hypothetical protein